MLISDIASTLAFACLIRGRDFVLFDDESLTGFIGVMQESAAQGGISALQLAGILLGEIVAQEQSAITFMIDKREGDFIIIHLEASTAYSNDEAMRHAIVTAWGRDFMCVKLLAHKEGTFVLFCPATHQDRVLTYVKENLSSIQSEIKSSFSHIMTYVNMIEELRLGSLFEQQPRAKLTRPGLIVRSGEFLVDRFRNRIVREEVIQTVASLLRKFFFPV